MARRKSAYEGSDELVKNDSLLKATGRKALGFAGGVGNVLSIPGDIVKGVLSGDANKAVAPVLHPISGQGRISGRDLNRQFGLAGRKDNWSNFGGGLATDILTDPLTYLTGGMAAGGKGLRILKAASGLDDLTRIAARQAGKAAGTIGKAEARTTTTLAHVIQHAEPDVSKRVASEAAKQGVSLHEPLGNVFGVGLPFSQPAALFGGQKAARALDTAASAVKNVRIPGTNFQPINEAHKLLDSSIKGMTAPVMQAAAKTLFGRKESGRAGARALVADYAHKLVEMGKHDDPKFLRQLLEEPVKGPRALYNAQTPELRSLVDAYHADMGKALRGANEWGIDVRKYIDPEAEYLPRYLAEAYAESGKSGRHEFLNGIKGGTTTLQQIATDPALNQIIDGGGTVQDIQQHLWTNYNKDIPTHYGPKNNKDRYKAMAEWLASIPPEVRKSGVYANHPLVDIQARHIGAANAVATAKTGLETLAKDVSLLPPTKAARYEGMTLRDLLKQSGIQQLPALRKIAKFQGANLASMSRSAKANLLRTLRDSRVDASTADEFVKLVAGHTPKTPPNAIIKAIDSATNLTKAGLTSIFPGFHTRNLGGGQWNNLLGGMFGSQDAAHAMLRGGTVKGASQIPEVQELAAQKGLGSVDDVTGTKLLRELAYSQEVLGKYEGLGQVAGHAGGTINDLLGEMPGHFPVSGKDILQKATARAPGTDLNPLNIRGFGEREATTFGPAAAGQDVGHYVEGLNRLSPFIQQLKKGVAPAEAAKRVGGAQVKYSARYFTPFERDVLSRAMPFYKFSKGMVPFHAKQLLERPGGALAATIKGVNRANSPDESVPEHISETASLPLGENKQGDKRFLTSLGLPFEDTAQLLTPSARGMLLEGLSRLNPLIKGPLEYATGTSFFQKGPNGARPLGELDPTLGRILANVSGNKQPVAFPGSNAVESLLANSPLSRLLTTTRTLTDSRKGPGAKAMNLLTGTRLTDVSKAQQEREQIKRIQEIERDLGGRMSTDITLSKAQIAAMPPAEQKIVGDLLNFRRALEKRARDRKKELAKR